MSLRSRLIIPLVVFGAAAKVGQRQGWEMANPDRRPLAGCKDQDRDVPAAMSPRTSKGEDPYQNSDRSAGQGEPNEDAVYPVPVLQGGDSYQAAAAAPKETMPPSKIQSVAIVRW